jgi:hypothetical protein
MDAGTIVKSYTLGMRIADETAVENFDDGGFVGTELGLWLGQYGSRGIEPDVADACDPAGSDNRVQTRRAAFVPQ